MSNSSSLPTDATTAVSSRKLIRGLANLAAHQQPCVATIGSFDGVHLGHQTILQQLKRVAEQKNLPCVVIVFEPQPNEFFSAEKAPARLMRLREKLKALWAVGVEKVLVLRFNQDLRQLSADEFIQTILVKGLAVKHLVVGDDFRFGCDRKGDFNLLIERGKQLGFEVSDTHTLQMDGDRISSTRIRKLLELGDFAEAQKLLGHAYKIHGRIIYGKQLGRQLGVPTANVELRRFRSPLHGVFAVEVIFSDQQRLEGVANVGVRPTVNGDKKPLLEVHLFNFNQQIYGYMIDVVFKRKLRDEQKFNSLDELKVQLQTDIANAKSYFSLEKATS